MRDFCRSSETRNPSKPNYWEALIKVIFLNYITDLENGSFVCIELAFSSTSDKVQRTRISGFSIRSSEINGHLERDSPSTSQIIHKARSLNKSTLMDDKLPTVLVLLAFLLSFLLDIVIINNIREDSKTPDHICIPTAIDLV